MVRQAQIPQDFAPWKFFVWGLGRLDFPRFAQGACNWGFGIADWGFAAAGARDDKRTQFAGGESAGSARPAGWSDRRRAPGGGREDQRNPIGPVEAGESQARSSKSETSWKGK